MNNSLEEFGTEVKEERNLEILAEKAYIDSLPSVPPKTGNSPSDDRPIKSHNCQYSVDGLTFWPTGKTIGKLVSGVYCVEVCQQGLYFKKQSLVTDDLIKFEDGLPKEILDEINTFWDKKETFKKWKFLHKRGILLYGPAGMGKSCLVSQIMQGIQERDGIVILANGHPGTVQAGLTKIREIEPDRPIVCVLEDIDSTIKHYGEQEILALLDGEAQIDNVLNLATTNYPERLEKRIVNRPRRFDRVIKVGKIDERMRRAYFTQKLAIDGSDVERYVGASEGFSFAAMAELVISTKCLDLDFDTVVEKLDSLKDFKPDSEDDEEKKRMGFGELIKAKEQKSVGFNK